MESTAAQQPSYYSHQQAPSPPLTQWQAFKRALTSTEHFDYRHWLQVGCSAFFDCAMRMLGPCLVVLALVLIGSVAFLYYCYLLPLLVTRGARGGGMQQGGAWVRLLHGGWAFFLLFNVIFNYAACVLTPPGGLEEEEQQGQGSGAMYQYEEEGATYALAAGGNGNGNGAGRPLPSQQQQQHHGGSGSVDPRTFGFCKKCKIPRPPRAHHCHVCRRCVLKMDHHCPWINNCVGQNNYRPFVLFLIYMWLACAYGVALLWTPFLALVYGGQNGPHMPVIVGSLASERSAVVFVFVLAFSVGAALTGLLGWHVYLISTGQTTIEFYINKFRRERARLRGVLYANPYDLGSCQRNWGQVFGEGLPWWRALLPSTRSPPRQRVRRLSAGGGVGGERRLGGGGFVGDEEEEGDDGGGFDAAVVPLGRGQQEREGLLLRVV